MRTALLVAAWHVLGGLLLLCLRARYPHALLQASAVLWGAALYVAATLLLLVLHVPYTLHTVALVIIGALAVLCWRAPQRPGRGMLLALLAGGAVVGALGAAGEWLNIAPMTSDSSGQVLMGRSLALYGGLDPSLAGWVSKDFGWFANFPAVVAVLHSSAVFLGLPYHAGVTPVLFVALLATMCVVLFSALREWCGPWLAALIPASGAALCVSSFMFATQAFYVHNALPAAIGALLFTVHAWWWQRTGDAAYARLAALALVFYGTTRLEAWVYGGLLLLPLLAHDGMTARLRAQCVALFSLPLALWYARLYTVTTEYSYMLTPTRAILMTAALAFLPLATWLLERFGGAAAFRFAAALSLFGAAAVVALLWALRPGHMFLSAASIVQNGVAEGAWQYLWFVLLAGMIASAGLPAFPGHTLWSRGALAVFLLITVMSSAKNPYRLGWSDSANRLLVQFVPLIVIYLGLRFGHAARAMAGDAPRPPYRWGATLAPLCALTLLCAAASTPQNYARTATVYEAPQTAKGYSFQVSLELRAGFASAVERCPSELVFGWESPVTASWLEVVEHDPQRGLRDFAWDWSSDGRNWNLLLDSRLGGPLLRWPGEPAHYALALPAAPIRYVRLVARHAAGEKRVLMERIRVWTSLSPDKRGDAAVAERWTPTEHVLAHLDEWRDAGGVDWARGAAVVRAGEGIDVVPPQPLVARRPPHEPRVRPRMLFDGKSATTIEAVVDLGWTVSAEQIKVAGESMFAGEVATSADGASWRPAASSDGHFVPAPEAFRYVRLAQRDGPPVGMIQRIEVTSALDGALREALPLARERGVPIDLAALSVVKRAPECAPGYGFEIALRGRSDGHFVSAIQPCPVEVVVDLQTPHEVQLLELFAHDAARAWTDFEIAAAGEDERWEPVFDTRDAQATFMRLDELRWGFDLRRAGPVRYVRITLRAARGENRLLLNRMALWSTFDLSASPTPIRWSDRSDP
ncbi:MAG: discoidin domain-containing protein [Phycisphaerae bacterium]|jgi:hypothetical protein